MKKCEICEKLHERKHAITRKYSKYCSSKCAAGKCHLNRQEKFRKNEIFKEKHRLEERERYWKKRGLSPDKDRLIAKAGNGCITKWGYKRLTMHGHPNAAKSGAIFEHVYIMSKHIGRPLYKGETVHHKNGERLDNRIENLELWSKSHPFGQRVKDKIEWCKEFLAQYGYKTILELNQKSV